MAQFYDGTNNHTDRNDERRQPIASKHAQGRSEPERDSHPNNNNTSTTLPATTTITTTDTKTRTTTTTTTTSLTTPAKTTSHNEKDESKAINVARTRDRDAPIALAVPHICLLAMTGTRQQVQHLHEIATKYSRPAVQKTVLEIKSSGTILRRNQQPHRPQRRTTAANSF